MMQEWVRKYLLNWEVDPRTEDLHLSIHPLAALLLIVVLAFGLILCQTIR